MVTRHRKRAKTPTIGQVIRGILVALLIVAAPLLGAWIALEVWLTTR
jgi:hypothetical protein